MYGIAALSILIAAADHLSLFLDKARRMCLREINLVIVAPPSSTLAHTIEHESKKCIAPETRYSAQQIVLPPWHIWLQQYPASLPL